MSKVDLILFSHPHHHGLLSGCVTLGPAELLSLDLLICKHRIRIPHKGVYSAETRPAQHRAREPWTQREAERRSSTQLRDASRKLFQHLRQRKGRLKKGGKLLMETDWQETETIFRFRPLPSNLCFFV